MKKVFNLFVLVFLSFLLVSCQSDQQSYTITFYDGEKVINTQFLEKNDLLLEPNIPVKDGVSFEYWLLNDNKFEGFNKKVKKDLDLYAKWSDSISISLSSYYKGFDLEKSLNKDFRDKLNERLYRDAKIYNYNSSTIGRKLRIVDEPASMPGYVYTIYDGVNMKHSDRGASGSNVWNNEHVVPRSWFNKVNQFKVLEGDLHNLRASNAKINSDKGNFPFIDGSGDWFVKGNRFYPGDGQQGDTARIIYYMLIMISDKNVLHMNKIFPDGTGFDTLLKWHLEDPVDDFELRRNDLTFGLQNNRNPFIDHPELVYAAWFDEYQKDIQFVN